MQYGPGRHYDPLGGAQRERFINRVDSRGVRLLSISAIDAVCAGESRDHSAAVRKQHLDQATSLINTSDLIGLIVGKLISGIMIAAIPFGMLFALNGTAF
ncbi:hypothetical protein QNN00_07595 [Bacillus velezensis]|nr:hypothetical protein [Bacillus velezensis]